MENELTSLKAEYEKLNKANQGLLASAEEKGKLEEKINLLEGENGTLKKKIANLENKPAVEKLKDSISSEKNPAVKKILEGALRDITMPQAGSSVNLDEILVKKDTGAAPAGMAKNVLPKDGKVISLDTRNKLVAVSLGQKDGIALNDKCIIVNANNELLANGTIISLRYQLSAVSVDRMKEKFRFEDIKKGDWVFISKR
jgi:predicted RNase H-like nuclease (RuvC/YqgF family)